MEKNTAADALHAAIMNIPCITPQYNNRHVGLAYMDGHRDARHAAAELAASHPAPQAAAEGVGSIGDEALYNAIICLQPAKHRDIEYKRGFDDASIAAAGLVLGRPAAPERAAIQQAGDADKALIDALNYGTGVMMGGKHVPYADLFAIPQEAKAKQVGADYGLAMESAWAQFMESEAFVGCSSKFVFGAGYRAALATRPPVAAPDAEAMARHNEQVRSAALEDVGMLREVLAVVRGYPDFDNSEFGTMIDEAIAGKRPALLSRIEALSQPSPAVKSAEPTEHPAIAVLREVKMEDVAGYKERGFVISTGLRAKIQALLNEAGDDPFMSAEPTGGAA